MRKNFAAVDATLATCTRCAVPDPATTADRRCGHRCPPRRRRSSDDGADDGGPRRRLPVSALPVDGTYPTGTTRGRSATSPSCRSGTRTSASSAASACFVCPHASSAPRSTTRALLADAPAGFKSAPINSAASRATARYTLQVSPRTAPAALCVEVCPAKSKSRGPAQGDQHGPEASRSARARGPTGTSSRPARERPLARSTSTISADAAPGAAVRVLRRLRRLRRDALPQAALAAVRRPPADRQRHRLLVDLRRQPADDALDEQPPGRGPAWSNSLFEDNAEFGLGMRLAVDKHLALAASCSAASWCGRSARTWSAILEATSRSERRSRSAPQRGASPS